MNLKTPVAWPRWWRLSRLPMQRWRCVCMQAGWDSSQGDRSEAGNEREAFWSFLTEVPFSTGFLSTLVAAACGKAGGIFHILFLSLQFHSLPFFIIIVIIIVSIIIIIDGRRRLHHVYSPAPSLLGYEATGAVFFFQGHSWGWATVNCSPLLLAMGCFTISSGFS